MNLFKFNLGTGDGALPVNGCQGEVERARFDGPGHQTELELPGAVQGQIRPLADTREKTPVHEDARRTGSLVA